MFQYAVKTDTFLYVSQWMLIVSMISTIIVMLALFWKARSYPLNYGLLAIFTLLEAHAVGTIGNV